MTPLILDGKPVCLGRLASDPAYPRVFMSRYTMVGLPPPPATADYTAKIAKFPMMLNDRYGDCVIAAQGHAAQVFTAYGSGQETVLDDKTIQTAYFTQTGGRDSGLNIPESLDYWVKHGLGGVKLSAYASNDPRDQDSIKRAIAWFGNSYFGVNLPPDCMDAINNNTDWDVTRYAPDPNAGHAIVASSYTEKGPVFITWGRKVQASWAWAAKYGTDAEVLLSPDWTSKVLTPADLDIGSLLDDFQALTGKKPPIPDNTPQIDWFV